MDFKKLSLGDVGNDVADLHENLIKRGFAVSSDEVKRKFFGPATREAVSECQKARRLEISGEVDVKTAGVLGIRLASTAQRSEPASSSAPDLVNKRASQSANQAFDGNFYKVVGTVASPNQAEVWRLRVEIVDKNVGGDMPLAETVTDHNGGYEVMFTSVTLEERGKQQPDLQARIFAGTTLLGASKVRYNASDRETLNVLLTKEPVPALTSEVETLTSALSEHFKGNLRDLKETDERQDITYLAHKTNWDARAVAMAALADQFSARTSDVTGVPAIPQIFFYALFRAGLPANEDMLYHISADTLESVWRKAAEQGVIPKHSTAQIPVLIGKFQALSAQKLLSGSGLMGVSPFKDLLAVSDLNEAQQAMFAQLYATNRGDMPKFWKAVADAFGQDTAKRLQIDGKLGYLTINNAPLIGKLHSEAGKNGLLDLRQLAQTGYHSVESWKQLLTPDIAIPEEIPGSGEETRRANYAGYLAAQVRLSYPTAAVAQMIKSGKLSLTGATDGISDQVHEFLALHQDKFEIGVQPIQQYIAENNLLVAEEIVQQVKRLQRVYQITPSDQAMAGLLKHGIDAAHYVVRHQKNLFIKNFAADLGGAEDAGLIYDRSMQIHNVVLNVAVSYLSARTAPAIGARNSSSVLDPAPANTGDIIAYATLESLFGSVDFCACEHCRSILSPAAYLVDLLLFIDQPNPTAGENPQNVLLERRPDIQYLPLTCDNTNTALPYIDVVNETLEYFIANNSQKLSLKDYHGHDTSGAVSEDLLANPQYVMSSAYAILRDERFPAPLPFHQSLESLRRYFGKFEVPLPLAMEHLRKSDDLERGGHLYGWRDIWMEEINLSRAEYEILTDFISVPLWRMYGFPNGTADAKVIAGLSNVKQFARRVGITYDDLISIVKTRFINPNGNLVPKLEHLGVSFSTLKALKDGTITDAAFDSMLPTGLNAPDPAKYGGDIKAWIKNQANYERIVGLITLIIPAETWSAAKSYAIGDCVLPTAAQPDSTLYFVCTTPGISAASAPKWPTAPGEIYTDGTVVWISRTSSSCLSFENVAFRYSDPAKITQNVSAVEFVRLLRFIRLWKKLGWTIEQTDTAVCALYREDLAQLDANDINDVIKLDNGFKAFLPRIGILVRAMNSMNLTVKSDLLSALGCWSDFGTYGNSSLYRQMFLNPALLEQDAIFADNGYGEFLKDSIKPLAMHAEALRSAFNLTGDEYDRVVATLGYDTGTALTIPNASAIYRRGWLARKLKLSVRELLLLIQLTGLDPFAVPDPSNPALLGLINFVQGLKDSLLKPTDALYLIWNQDLSGTSRPDLASIAGFARILRAGFSAVEADFAIADDPDGAIAQTRMTMIYGTDAANFFFGLLNDTLTVEVEFSDPEETLVPGAVRWAIDNAAGKTDTGVTKIYYDDFRKSLSYSGVLTAGTRDLIKSAAGAAAAVFKSAVDNLYEKNQAVTGPFFARYSELKAPYEVYVSDTSHSAAEKRSSLLKGILPDLIKRRKRQQALQSVSAMANSELDFTQAFLDPPAAPFPMHAAHHDDQPALNDFLMLEKQGLSVQFFASDTVKGAIIPAPDIASKLDYSPIAGGVGNPLPANPTPGAAISGVWSGYLEAPENGFFNLYIDTDPGATVTLTLDGKSISFVQNAAHWNNTDPIALQAGTLYSVRLAVEKVVNVMHVQWDWEPKGQGRAAIPERYLYPHNPFAAFRDIYIRFLKVASLSVGLGLTANELAFFATHADYRINAQGTIDPKGQSWLNFLPNADNLHLENPADRIIAKNLNAALLTPLNALVDFARIKADISLSDESLLTILKDPGAATQNADGLLYAITRWNRNSLNDLLAQFSGDIAGLGHFDLLRRVYDAFALIRKMGISAKALIQATTNEPSADTVRDLQAALRARYTATDWRDVIRPMNDEMRVLRRDALVTYIIHEMQSHLESAHINTPDKLFEYFLMDVQMDACMQTSRIRHALSSVQLFIERCLMNLETRVSPAAINAKQWEWMKRYRVWEANRKVYLFPENWLEPELRDDKSPFFKEIESQLLQGDITEESAATALLNYLSKLDEVAKLQPCGIHHIPRDEAKRTGEINHVVARTAGAHRKYYYRRFEYGYWTPWEQIKLDIEDNPIIPVVWNDRLFLFWLKILKRGSYTAQSTLNAGDDVNLTSLKIANIKKDPPAVVVEAILCYSEFYNGKWQPTKTSDVNRPLGLGTFSSDTSSSAAFDRSRLMLFSNEHAGPGITISIQNDSDFVGLFSIFGWSFYNTHSLPLQDTPGFKYPEIFKYRSYTTSYTTKGAVFNIHYEEYQFLPGEGEWKTSVYARDVLTEQTPVVTVQPNHRYSGPWEAPFFFEDHQNMFYVSSISMRDTDFRDFGGFGIISDSVVLNPQILPLTVQRVPPIVSDHPTVHSVVVPQFITEDATIDKNVGMTGTVTFGGRQIEPSGSIPLVRNGR